MTALILDYNIRGITKEGIGVKYADADFTTVGKHLAWLSTYNEVEKSDIVCWLCCPELLETDENSFKTQVPEIRVAELEITNATALDKDRGFVARINIADLADRHRALIWEFIHNSADSHAALGDDSKLYDVQQQIAEIIDAECSAYESGGARK